MINFIVRFGQTCEHQFLYLYRSRQLLGILIEVSLLRSLKELNLCSVTQVELLEQDLSRFHQVLWLGNYKVLSTISCSKLQFL